MAVMGDEIQFKAYEQQQGQLLPGFVGEALDPSDPVFFVDDLVEGLDLRSFEQRYEAMGEHAYPPRMLLKLWLFGAIAGVYSGREIARRLFWDLRFRYLAGDLRPDFRTINRFRERHRAPRCDSAVARPARVIGSSAAARRPLVEFHALLFRQYDRVSHAYDHTPFSNVTVH